MNSGWSGLVVKILVVVTIMGVLAALMLPATQSAREAARRPMSKFQNANDAFETTTTESKSAPETSRTKAGFVYFQAPQNVQRRIIYDANLVLVVNNMAETEVQIDKLVKQANGYVAEASVDRQQGENLTARWRLRVPTAQFNMFLDAVAKLGVAETRNQTAQDVTEEFVDLEAQIANKKKLEERIVALLKDSSGKIKDVIEVERELARVRGEIEQMEGRLRYLANRTDFTTVSISARVEENYTPPAAPSFGDRIAQAWHTSLGSLREFAEKLAIVAAIAAPWLATLCVVAVPAFFYMRRRAMNSTDRGISSAT